MITKESRILPIKLYVPAPKKAYVSRARLLKQLNTNLERKLTLVSAPAGYGKSALLSEWVWQVNVPVAWLSLDQRDNDPSRFWSYFQAALHTIPGLKDAWDGDSTLNSQQTPSFPENETLLADLIIAVSAVPERFVLILDDLHAITEAELLDGLFFMLENLPPGPEGMHLVIASRNDPPWPLARLRAQNEITEVRAKDLRFTPGETSVFINEVMGLALTPGEITELDQRTEGWIAGLQMAAISMQGRDDLSSFLEAFTGSHRFVLDFLVEEVLSGQPPEILDFLLRTSILEQLNGALCSMVTGDPGGSDMLLALEKANLFLVALDEQRTWYRYHPLFADLLQKQLRVRASALIPELHRRASQWYVQNGFPREAVTHALETKDWDYAAARVEESILDLIQHGEMALARQWICALPEEEIRSRPILCIAQVWTAANYATLTLAEELLAQVETMLSTQPGDDGMIDPQVYEFVNRQIALLQVVIARVRGDSPHKQRALALEALNRIIPPEDIASRAMALLRIGLCYIDLGKDEQADRTLSQAFRLGKSSGNHYAAHAANYGRMVITRRRGQLHRLADICRQTLDDGITEDQQQRSLHGFALIMSGGLYYEWNDFDQAEHLLAQGLKASERMRLVELLIKGYFALACLKAAQGHTTQIPDLIKMAEDSHPGIRRFAAALQVQLYLLLARSGQEVKFDPEIMNWSETQELVLMEESIYDWEIYEKLVYARVCCRQYTTQPSTGFRNSLEEILAFTRTQRQILDDLNWHGVLVEVNIVMALILYALERKSEALDAFKQALDLAEPQGYLRTFVDEGQPVRELLQQALAERIHSAYARRLLSAFDSQRTSSQPQKTLQPDALHEPLSERELQVLCLLNTQLSVPEIATEIHLAPTTVRTHVQHIYQKLGVHGRIEALQRAVEIGLL